MTNQYFKIAYKKKKNLKYYTNKNSKLDKKKYIPLTYLVTTLNARETLKEINHFTKLIADATSTFTHATTDAL